MSNGQSIPFGAAGLGAFIYGKTMVLYKPIVVGVALMDFSYFVHQTWLMCTISCACNAHLPRPAE